VPRSILAAKSSGISMVIVVIGTPLSFMHYS
jgi:hypothetical protein